jgi:RNA polymerase sigma factor (sigma-70 family)
VSHLRARRNCTSDAMAADDPALVRDELLAQLGWVRALARRLVADPDVTDDVLQQVCLLALQRTPSDARAGPRLRAWLAGLTRAIVRNSARADRRRLLREQTTAQPEALPATDDIAARREALRSLMEAVTSLQEPYFSVIVERYFDGRSVAEIAVRHGTSPEAVRQQLTRARQQLRSRLQALLADDRHGWMAAALPLAPLTANLKGAPAKLPFVPIGGLLVAKSLTTSATAICIGLIIFAFLLVGTWLSRDPAPPDTRPLSMVSGSEAATAGPASVSADAMKLDLERAVPVPTALPTERAAVPTTGQLSVSVTWETDGRPAADVTTTAVFWDTPHPHLNKREGVTDATGRWRLPDCPLGQVIVGLDRANGERVEVRAGEVTELHLVIPAGVLVRGLVVDPDERPVPDAEVYVELGFPSVGSIIARADDDGRFTLRDMANHNQIGARSKTHLPSPLVRISDSPGHQQEITLRLGDGGAHLIGRVLSADGDGVAGAVVIVGPEHGWPAPEGNNGVVVSGPPARRLRTDAEGRFDAHNLPRGTTPVAARGADHSPWRGTCFLETGRTEQLDIELPAPAKVSGIVSDDDGRPVPEARVHSGGYSEIDWVETVAGTDGRYELTGLALGTTSIEASLKGVGKDETELSVGAGAELHWDPHLTKGLQIVGRVLDAFESPLVGCHVDAKCYQPGRTIVAQAVTDGQGRFTLNNCGDGMNELQVYYPTWTTLVASQQGVRPGPDEVVLRVDLDARSTAFVIGRVLDARGRVPELAKVITMDVSTGRGQSSTLDPDTGTFRCGPLRGGDWDLFVLAQGYPQLRVARLTLVEDETRDIGTVTLSDPGRVIVHVDLAAGVTIERLFLNLDASHGQGGGRLHL